MYAKEQVHLINSFTKYISFPHLKQELIKWIIILFPSPITIRRTCVFLKFRVLGDFTHTETRYIIFQLGLPYGDMSSDRFRHCKYSHIIDNNLGVLEISSIGYTLLYHNPYQMIYWNYTGPSEPTPQSDRKATLQKNGKKD